VDYDEELFDDEDFETNYESDDEEDEDDKSNQYDDMDVNELADITNEMTDTKNTMTVTKKASHWNQTRKQKPIQCYVEWSE
jgi:hypothetical protein